MTQSTLSDRRRCIGHHTLCKAATVAGIPLARAMATAVSRIVNPVKARAP
jgi:hypothetical protein